MVVGWWGGAGWLRHIGVEWRWISLELTNKSLLLAAQPSVCMPSCLSWQAGWRLEEPLREDALKLPGFARRGGALIQLELFRTEAVGHFRRIFHGMACGRVLTDRLQPSIMNEPSLLQCRHSRQALRSGTAPESHHSADASLCSTCKT